MNELQGFWWTVIAVARMWFPVEVRWLWRAHLNR